MICNPQFEVCFFHSTSCEIFISECQLPVCTVDCWDYERGCVCVCVCENGNKCWFLSPLPRPRVWSGTPWPLNCTPCGGGCLCVPFSLGRVKSCHQILKRCHRCANIGSHSSGPYSLCLSGSLCPSLCFSPGTGIRTKSDSVGADVQLDSPSTAH